MGRTSSIDPEKGHELIEAYGRLGSVRAAAAEVGVSKDAASRYLATLPKATAPTVVQQEALIATAGASLWDTRHALDENYRRIIKLLDQLDAGIVVQNGETVTLTPVATNVAAIREARAHIESSMTLAKLLIDVDEVRKFQESVLEAIAEADEPTRQRIIHKLRERRAVGLALSGH